MKRVVVTGFGTVCPLGADVETAWRRLIAGENGISRITRFDVGDIASKVGGQVLIGDEPGAFDPKSVMNPKELRKNDMFIVFAIAAADQAIRMSGWAADNDEAAERTGVLIGSGIGGLPMIVKSYHVLSEKGPRRLSPFFIPSCLINLASGQVSIRHGFKGPNHSIVTACSTGSHAIGDAARLIILGDADVMVAGGAESQICSLGLAGFSASRALSTSFNDTPEKASRPFDKDRDGFVAAEGAGIVVLEEYEHAKRRGAPILAELVGYGLSGDAYHITAPSPDGGGAYRAMKAALARAGLPPEDIDAINAHGTSTQAGDEVEVGAVKRLFGPAIDDVCMSSTKSAIGHMLGAAGALEAIFSILTIRDGIVPPTRNLDNPSEGCRGIDLVPHTAREKPVRTVMSNSFGFGGTNASLIFKAVR